MTASVTAVPVVRSVTSTMMATGKAHGRARQSWPHEIEARPRAQTITNAAGFTDPILPVRGAPASRPPGIASPRAW